MQKSEVLETTKNVSQNSKFVQIDQEALNLFIKKLDNDDTESSKWDIDFHYYDGTEKTVAYLLILDTLNFCFWSPPGKQRWVVPYQGGDLDGYNALAVALKRAMESGTPMDGAEYLAELSLDALKRILDGTGELLLMDQRKDALNELGRLLIDEFDGKAHRLVEAANGSAIKLTRLLADRLISFRDIADYEGHKVCFYKRAQIFVSDLYMSYRGDGWGYFSDLDQLTAFADYKVPQVLRHLGILRYADSLSQKIDEMQCIPAGSPEEIEIRANTIWAIEMMRQVVNHQGKTLMAREIDWILWNMGQHEDFRERPYHRTVTIFY